MGRPKKINPGDLVTLKPGYWTSPTVEDCGLGICVALHIDGYGKSEDAVLVYFFKHKNLVAFDIDELKKISE